MQGACLLLCHFHCHKHCPVELINNGISKPVSPPSLSHFIRGITAHRHRPPLAIQIEKLATVSLSVVLFFSPIPNIFSSQPFSIKFQFCCWRWWPSLGPQGDNSLLPPSPYSQISQRNRQWRVCLLFLFPPIPNIFSQQPFWINLLFWWPCLLPRLNQQGEEHPTASILCLWVM
jgi:hypothetical protein